MLPYFKNRMLVKVFHPMYSSCNPCSLSRSEVRLAHVNVCPNSCLQFSTQTLTYIEKRKLAIVLHPTDSLQNGFKPCALQSLHFSMVAQLPPRPAELSFVILKRYFYGDKVVTQTPKSRFIMARTYIQNNFQFRYAQCTVYPNLYQSDCFQFVG